MSADASGFSGATPFPYARTSAPQGRPRAPPPQSTGEESSSRRTLPLDVRNMSFPHRRGRYGVSQRTEETDLLEADGDPGLAILVDSDEESDSGQSMAAREHHSHSGVGALPVGAARVSQMYGLEIETPSIDPAGGSSPLFAPPLLQVGRIEGLDMPYYGTSTATRVASPVPTAVSFSSMLADANRLEGQRVMDSITSSSSSLPQHHGQEPEIDPFSLDAWLSGSMQREEEGRSVGSGFLPLSMADILPPLTRAGELARKPHHDYTMYSRHDYNAEMEGRRYPASLRPPVQALPSNAGATPFSVEEFGLRGEYTPAGSASPSANNSSSTISPSMLAAELSAMDISSTPMSHASWRVDELPLDAPRGGGPGHPEVLTVPPGSSSLSLSSLSKSKTGGKASSSSSSSSTSQAMSTSEPVGASLASLALAASLSPRSEAPLFGNEAGGDRAIPREVRRGNASFVITEHGEFPIEDEILTWSREQGFMSWLHRAPGRPIPDDERATRNDLQHVRCHYCVNGPNVNQKRSKWLTKCRNLCCKVWYCQTHYPMFSRTRKLFTSDRSTFDSLCAFEDTPFICLFDFGACCCSPNNDKCSDHTSKLCKTFGAASHKCEKTRHLVYNRTKRARKKAAASSSKAAKGKASAASAASSSTSASSSAASSSSSSSSSTDVYRKRGNGPPTSDEEDRRRNKRQKPLS